MGDVARCSIGRSNDYHNEELLYILFGINAEMMTLEVEEEMQLGKDVSLLEDPADPALWAAPYSNESDE